MQNGAIAEQFEELAELLEIQGANPFRVRAYRNAARAILDSTESIAAVADDISKSCASFPASARTSPRRFRRSSRPAAFRSSPSCASRSRPASSPCCASRDSGPKVFALFQEHGIRSLDELRMAAEQNRIAGIKGFGKKTQDAILKGLEIAETAGHRVYLAEAKRVAEDVVDDLRSVPGVRQLEIAGSCRRRKETCGDLDLLAEASQPDAIMDRLAGHRLVESIIARGDTKMSVRLFKGLQLDLRVVPGESFGAACSTSPARRSTTSSSAAAAQDAGLKLNEYGVFRGDEMVAGRPKRTSTPPSVCRGFPRDPRESQ